MGFPDSVSVAFDGGISEKFRYKGFSLKSRDLIGSKGVNRFDLIRVVDLSF